MGGCVSTLEAQEFSPDPAGTLLPDGSRWGAWTGGAKIIDKASVFASHEVKIIVSGIRWSEGPVWVAAEKSLYFVDTIDARIYRWRDGVTTIVASEGGGFDGSNVPEFETLFEPGPNGMALAGESLIICQHPTRRLIRMRLSDLASLQGKRICEAPFEVVATTAPNGKRFNAPNDCIIAPNGDIFFTDPVYGFLKKQRKELGYAYVHAERGEHPDQPYLDKAVQQQGVGFTGVYRVRNGAVELVTSQLERPNGLAFSADGKLLWVANSVKDTPSWHAFELREQLPLERAAVLDQGALGEAVQLGPGLSDGLKVDELGRIWGSTPGGLVVIDPVAKRVLASVKFATNISNVRFGDGPDVFVTGLGHVWLLQRAI